MELLSIGRWISGRSFRGESLGVELESKRVGNSPTISERLVSIVK